MLPRYRPFAASFVIRFAIGPCNVSEPAFIKTRELFSTPLFAFEIKGADSLNRRLIKDIDAMQATESGIVRSNQHGWHSERDFFKREEASIRELGQHLLRCSAMATNKMAPSLRGEGLQIHAEGWVNVNDGGAFNTPHDHPAYLWSGVYYVKVPQKQNGRSGMIEFLDPRGALTLNDRDRRVIGASKFRVEPKEGLLVLFPSFLVHWVYPNEKDETRISIAFNARLVPDPAKLAKAKASAESRA